jgi:hypothetical protein
MLHIFAKHFNGKLLKNSGVTYVNVPGSQRVQEFCADKALQMKQVTAAAATAAGQDDMLSACTAAGSALLE